MIDAAPDTNAGYGPDYSEDTLATHLKLRKDMSLDELFDDLRQGSRNVAGVTWQVAVSVDLLVTAYAGDLPFSAITPEGIEDLDCEHHDGSRTFVQMKEVQAGEGRLAAADVADALKHAEDGARGSRIALVTDGTLGSGMIFTGWRSFIANQGGDAVEDVTSALEKRGFTSQQAQDIVTRSRIIHRPWRLRDRTENTLCAAANIHPTVSAFVVSQLNETLASIAADQRSKSRSKAIRLMITDVDSVVHDVQSAVDISGLEKATEAGLCAPADFLNASGLAAEEFYLGVDGHPGHITAGLDVLRPRELVECAEGAATERYVLILGPSGAGKSVLMWRAARDAVPGARVLRVRRVDKSSDVDLLVRHIRLMRASATSPVVVAADNLGRPGMTAWPAAASALREQPHTVLIGACRAEDFHPSLAVGAVRIVEPRVDESTAKSIAEKIQTTGLSSRMDVIEAHQDSGGLLMEFLALLTTGRRLRQVLATQVDRLKEPGRALQREAARLLTAAHSVGLGLDADRLGRTLTSPNESSTPPYTTDDVGSALSVLKDEHIVIGDGRNWHGLHELRSRTLTELLHDSPPPTLAATWARTIPILTPTQAGWLLRRVAERSPTDLPTVSEAAARLISAPTTTVVEAAELLEGAERADNAAYALACQPILERFLRPGLSIHNLAMFAYGIRNQGLELDNTGVGNFDATFRSIKQIASLLPDRSAAEFTAATSTVSAGLDSEVLARLLHRSSLHESLRLLEATVGHGLFDEDIVANLIKNLPKPENAASAALFARLIYNSADQLELGKVSRVFGSIEERVRTVIEPDPDVLSVDVDRTNSTITVTRILPLEMPQHTNLPWDTTPKNRTTDIAHSGVMDAAQRLADACPEISRFKISTVTASGKIYKIGDFETGAKDLKREVFKDRVGVRRSVGFQAALRRATAADSWTHILKEQIDIGVKLARLTDEGIARINSRDNAGRRAGLRQSRIPAA